MSKKTFILLFFILLVRLTYGQTIEVFDYKLYSEKLTLCELISKFVDPNKNFEYTHFDSSFYSIKSYNNKSNIFGDWTFISRNDSINQICWTSIELPITEEWFKILYGQADSLINTFTIKHGQPIKFRKKEKKFYKPNHKLFPTEIMSATWIIDEQKLKVDFIVPGEHKDFYYMIRIQKFKDYYGNSKLNPGWDGY